jgi:hypothetical protein
VESRVEQEDYLQGLQGLSMYGDHRFVCPILQLAKGSLGQPPGESYVLCPSGGVRSAMGCTEFMLWISTIDINTIVYYCSVDDVI